MNPYDFVRVVWQQPGERRAAPRHDRFAGISGRLEGTITVLMPVFIPDKRRYNAGSSLPQPFLTDQKIRLSSLALR